MQTTIDKAGRIVVPKAIRDELGLTPGVKLDIAAVDGRVEIKPSAVSARLEERDGVLVAVSDDDVPVLTDEVVRETLERVRR